MEKVFLLIVVLSGNTKLSNRNLQVQKSTWMKHIEKDVKVLTLSGSDKFNVHRKSFKCCVMMIIQASVLKH